LDEKSEEELIGTLVKLIKRESELYAKIDKLENIYQGPFHDAFEKKYPNGNDPERMFKAQVSINPDRIIALATELKVLQKEYAEAHTATKEFETAHPLIAKSFGTHYY
jgi:hypothetical protein